MRNHKSLTVWKTRYVNKVASTSEQTSRPYELDISTQLELLPSLETLRVHAEPTRGIALDTQKYKLHIVKPICMIENCSQPSRYCHFDENRECTIHLCYWHQ